MKTSLDLPDDLAEQLKSLAAEQRRSMNATIVFAIEAYVVGNTRQQRVSKLAAEVAERDAELLGRLAQ